VKKGDFSILIAMLAE